MRAPVGVTELREIDENIGYELRLTAAMPAELLRFGSHVLEVHERGKSDGTGVFLVLDSGGEIVTAAAIKTPDGYLIIPRELPDEEVGAEGIVTGVRQLVAAKLAGSDDRPLGVGSLVSLAQIGKGPAGNTTTYTVSSPFEATDFNLASENDGPGKALYREEVARWIQDGLRLSRHNFGREMDGKVPTAEMALILPENGRKVVIFPGMSDREMAIWRNYGFREEDMVLIEGELNRARALGKKYPDSLVIQRWFHKEIRGVMKDLERGLGSGQKLFAANLDPENRLTVDFQNAMERFLRESPIADIFLFAVNFLVSGQGGVSNDKKLMERFGISGKSDKDSQLQLRVQLVNQCIKEAVKAARGDFSPHHLKEFTYEGNTRNSQMRANMMYLKKVGT